MDNISSVKGSLGPHALFLLHRQVMAAILSLEMLWYFFEITLAVMNHGAWSSKMD